jgi:hypothetical protein
MLRRWKQAGRRSVVGGQGVTTEVAVMLKLDRCRHIDAVIDYFGGAREARAARSAMAVRARNGNVFTTDGPFAETKEQLGGGLAVGRA